MTGICNTVFLLCFLSSVCDFGGRPGHPLSDDLILRWQFTQYNTNCSEETVEDTQQGAKSERKRLGGKSRQLLRFF